MLHAIEAQLKKNYKAVFQWAPTLGGECYESMTFERAVKVVECLFQWAPTLGGECYELRSEVTVLSVDAFQWAPTLGGECYY